MDKNETIEEYIPNETEGTYFSSMIKITDLDTEQTVIIIRGDE